jgi:hypothetical protein|tara:strand:+ start:174 stop:347 length:174 start_codon:yes stop_codon:yes gene_type:complete
MVVESPNKGGRYMKPVTIGLAGQGAYGNLLAKHVNAGKLTIKEAKALLRYRNKPGKK